MIWPIQITLVTSAQSSGPLCFWQCLKLNFGQYSDADVWLRFWSGSFYKSAHPLIIQIHLSRSLHAKRNIRSWKMRGYLQNISGWNWQCFSLNLFGFWAEAWAYFPSVLVSPSEVLALFWSFMSESELVPPSHEQHFHTINLLLHLHWILIRWTSAGQLLRCKSIYFIYTSRIAAKIKAVFLWSGWL